jgi:hypothetical protein
VSFQLDFACRSKSNVFIRFRESYFLFASLREMRSLPMKYFTQERKGAKKEAGNHPLSASRLA